MTALCRLRAGFLFHVLGADAVIAGHYVALTIAFITRVNPPLSKPPPNQSETPLPALPGTSVYLNTPESLLSQSQAFFMRAARRRNGLGLCHGWSQLPIFSTRTADTSPHFGQRVLSRAIHAFQFLCLRTGSAHRAGRSAPRAIHTTPQP